ncbi:molybdopterin converting factor subunit 2 [Actinobacillus equuli]|nr:molybdopterin converting factor subunit 2 [Actinobacillus equuli]
MAVIHRIGQLHTGDEIVLVGVSSAHRGDAYHANEFIMDYLKTRAPFGNVKLHKTATAG